MWKIIILLKSIEWVKTQQLDYFIVLWWDEWNGVLENDDEWGVRRNGERNFRIYVKERWNARDRLIRSSVWGMEGSSNGFEFWLVKMKAEGRRQKAGREEGISDDTWHIFCHFLNLYIHVGPILSSRIQGQKNTPFLNNSWHLMLKLNKNIILFCFVLTFLLIDSPLFRL